MFNRLHQGWQGHGRVDRYQPQRRYSIELGHGYRAFPASHDAFVYDLLQRTDIRGWKVAGDVAEAEYACIRVVT
jgi:hypothetical protein